VRENVTPLVLENVVWAGTNLGSYSQATGALEKLSEVKLAPKQVCRITTDFGTDCVEQRRQEVAEHQKRPLMKRITPPPRAKFSELMAVMMDGGRYQRRDNFRDRKSFAEKASDFSAAAEARLADSVEKTTHWREDKVGIVLSLKSEVHAADPTPEFPDWLAGAKVVAEIAQLAAREEEPSEASGATVSEEPAWLGGLERPRSGTGVPRGDCQRLRLGILRLASGMESLDDGPAVGHAPGICRGWVGGQLDDPQKTLQPDDRDSRLDARLELRLARGGDIGRLDGLSPVCDWDLARPSAARDRGIGSSSKRDRPPRPRCLWK
jgi:hypothetical protein